MPNIGVLGLKGPTWAYLGLFWRSVGVPGPIRMRLGSYYAETLLEVHWTPENFSTFDPKIDFLVPFT